MTKVVPQPDQVVWQALRTDLLKQAGINPMSPAQIQVIDASFRGTDYVSNTSPGSCASGIRSIKSGAVSVPINVFSSER